MIRAHRLTSLLAAASCVLASAVFFPGCAAPQLDRRPLYTQLGGEPGLAALVDAFLRELAGDPDAAHHFQGVDIRRFRAQLTLHLCQLFDGPCRYEGAAMTEVHRGMQITQREFNAVVDDLIRAMESRALPTPVQNRVLARLAPLREQIIELPSDAGSDPSPH